ncbi:hypothetical protein GCM10010124_11270 [Pilimelia terevasa]|uniref:Excreted virulence factor EspC (Type VII ESX diderm) n=1 Tax=Pilimelia terevasa TaxID=53372 RepID=A0A8J3FG19_9ACTN|nr:hypothetical protein [Pilimelia terevasa]GGK20407.1 hypothetical protein GCM10010124_11270 [Pilimelia terevasa]
MNDLTTVAHALEDAARQLAASADLLHEAASDATSFGGDAAGYTGELGRALHARWVAALDARRREVDEARDEIAALRAAVADAASAYTDVDAAAAARWRSEER